MPKIVMKIRIGKSFAAIIIMRGEALSRRLDFHKRSKEEHKAQRLVNDKLGSSSERGDGNFPF